MTTGYKSLTELVLNEGVTLSDLLGAYSDRYKEINGVRPRFMGEWTIDEAIAQTEALQKEYDSYVQEADRQEAERVYAFNTEIKVMIANGASGEAQAIKWMLEADGVDYHNHYDLEMWVMDHNLPYTQTVHKIQNLLGLAG